MDKPSDSIIDRLERYTDLSRDDARSIARQALIALNIDDESGTTVLGEVALYELEDTIREESYQSAHREGYMAALRAVETCPVLSEDSVVRVECGKLAAKYLDEH